MTEYSVLATGPLAENCYLLWREKSAWIIDPGADPEEILAELDARGLTPVSILLTHGHFDHLGALDALLKRWDSETRSPEYHDDFNNFALALIYEELKALGETELAEKAMRTLTGAKDSRNRTVNRPLLF